jgi:hypothetical protein
MRSWLEGVWATALTDLQKTAEGDHRPDHRPDHEETP